MNDKTPSRPTGPVPSNRLWRVAYTYVSGLCELRSRAIIVTAVDTTEASEKAKALIFSKGLDAFRIGKIVEY